METQRGASTAKMAGGVVIWTALFARAHPALKLAEEVQERRPIGRESAWLRREKTVSPRASSPIVGPHRCDNLRASREHETTRGEDGAAESSVADGVRRFRVTDPGKISEWHG